MRQERWEETVVLDERFKVDSIATAIDLPLPIPPQTHFLVEVWTIPDSYYRPLTPICSASNNSSYPYDFNTFTQTVVYKRRSQ